jgi:hypothetical protein
VLYAFLVLCVVLEAVQQGVIVWVLREFVPVTYNGVNLGRYTGFALHFLGVASYLVVAAFVAHPLGLLLSVNFWLAVAVLRVLCFDVSLNITKNFMNHLFGRDNEPLFSTGTSSLTDKIIQAVAKLLHLNATVLSAGVRVVAGIALYWLV